MAEKITYELYNGKIKIDFYPVSHRYKKVGEKNYLISSTAVTGVLDKSRFLIPWAVGLAGKHLRQYLENAKTNNFTTEELLPVIDEALIRHQQVKEEAASIGDMVHDFCENFAKAKMLGTPIPKIDDLPEGALNGINGFLDWFRAQKSVQFLGAEELVYSIEHDFVGKLDNRAIINGSKRLVDYKTSKAVYNDHRYQVSSYLKGKEEELGEKFDGYTILHFDKETGEFHVYEESNREEIEKDFKAFLGLLATKRREKELSNF